MSNVIIGIDNGVSGSLAAISSHNGAFIDAITMPCKYIGKLNVIDGAKVVSWIKAISSCKVQCVAIEACPDHARKASIMRSMGISFGILFGAISTGMPYVKIVAVRSGTPKDSWQKFMLPDCKSGDTKPRALELAKRLWPDETFLATERSKVPHDGIVDAALLAEYARIKNL